MHSWRVAPDTVMLSGFTSSTLAVSLSSHSTSKVDPSTVYNVPLLAGHETEVAEGVDRVMFVAAVAFAKGAGLDIVTKVEENIVVFDGRDLFAGKELKAVGRARLTFGVVLKGSETLIGKELADVVTGNAMLDKFDEAEGGAAEGTEVELDSALDAAGGLAGAGM
jgi:hypothetical protein